MGMPLIWLDIRALFQGYPASPSSPPAFGPLRFGGSGRPRRRPVARGRRGGAPIRDSLPQRRALLHGRDFPSFHST